VADRIYTGEGNRDIDLKGKAITVTGNPQDPNMVVIDCQSSVPSDPNFWYAGFYIDSDAVIEGFTITGAAKGGIHSATGSPLIRNCMVLDNKFGIRHESGNPVIDSCTISNNAGFGISCDDGSPMIDSCTISNNSSAGIFLDYGATATIDSCIISDNNWGGIFGSDNVSTIKNCEISGNTSISGGGGIRSCRGLIINCIIRNNRVDAVGNYSWISGGGLKNCNGTISNCTITGNSAKINGGGLYDCDGTITNCIIWGNAAGWEGEQLYDSSTATYSWNSGGIGNINENPLFAKYSSDPNDWDLHLKSQAGRWDPNSLSWVTDGVTSPCIDAGDPGSDWRGELWPDGGRINMGAYGGTAEASMSLNPVGNAADFNKDDVVDYRDFGWYIDNWQLGEILQAEDIDRNNFVDMADVALFGREWLWEQ